MIFRISAAIAAGIFLVLNFTCKAQSDNVSKERQKLMAPEEAITLSRFRRNDTVYTMAVLEDDESTLTGINLSSELNDFNPYPPDLISTLPYDSIVKIIRNSRKAIRIRRADILPAVDGSRHIAMGVNYDEHGEETSVDAPFMFPKIATTSSSIHTIRLDKKWLLDYEVELGVVTSSELCTASDFDNQLLGFVVVNDFTDRATMIREIDVKNIKSGKGFPDAKGRKDFLPTGPYLVIPRDWRSFVSKLTLTLSVNKEIRQSAGAAEMVWDIEKIFREAIGTKGEKRWPYNNELTSLYDGSCIMPGSIIITGTPSGVIFNAPSPLFITKAVMKYGITFSFISRPMFGYIMNEYLKREFKKNKYLKVGDVVETSISWLGKIHTTITE